MIMLLSADDILSAKKAFHKLFISFFLQGGKTMRTLTIAESKRIKAGWTCWFPFCGAKGSNSSTL